MLNAGGISKTDIRRFLYWAADHLGYSELRSVVAAPPSAELEPIREGEEAQTDEQDMGMTYDVSYPANLPCCATLQICFKGSIYARVFVD